MIVIFKYIQDNNVFIYLVFLDDKAFTKITYWYT